MLRFLLDDEVRSVNATVWSERESAMLLLTMRGGLHAQLLASYGTIEQDRVEVFGTGGSLAISRYDSLVVERGPVMPAGGISKSLRRTAAEALATPYGIRKLRSPGADPSFADSIDNFLAAIESGSVATPDMDDGLRAAEVVEAARISSTERRSIELE
jgi:predicted dehydrogenase